MKFVDSMKGILDQGVTASKGFAVKAGAKAQNLGDKGVKMIEVKQLEGQAQKLIVRLGEEAYNAFVERGEDTLSKSSPAVSAILAEIAAARESIEKRQAELKAKKEQ